MKCCYVELVRMKLGVLNVELVDEECKLFSSMKTAEEWLLDNGFVYGQRMGTFAVLLQKAGVGIRYEQKEEFRKCIKELFQAGGMMELEHIDVILVERFDVAVVIMIQ